MTMMIVNDSGKRKLVVNSSRCEDDLATLHPDDILLNRRHHLPLASSENNWLAFS